MDRETFRNMTEDSPESKAMYKRLNRKLAFWRYSWGSVFSASIVLAAWLIMQLLW